MDALTLVIPATKTETLDRCLAAVRAAADGPDEIIVIDAPADAGPAAARNDGARRATGDIVCFLDADVLVHRDAFTRIRTAFAAAPELTAVFGSYDDEPGDPGVVSGFRNLLHHHVHQAGAGRATTFWSGLGAIRRADLLSAGGYDAARFAEPSVEDIELGMRLADAGGEVRLDPELRGTHLKRWTLTSMVRTDFTRRAVPWVEMLLERRRGSTALNLGWLHRVSAVASVTVVAAAVLLQLVAALAALGVLLVLNGRFYALLACRRGVLQALAGVGLHVVHHVTSVAAVPFGIVQHLRHAPRARPRPLVAVEPAPDPVS